MPDSVIKRAVNRAAILRMLQMTPPLRRCQLSAHGEIRPSSVSSIVQQLLAQQLIRPTAPAQAKSALELDPTVKHVLAVAITANGINAGRVFLDGHITDWQQLDLPRQASAATIIAAAATLLAPLHATAAQHVLGIGVSLPGIIDSARGICRQSVLFGREANVAVAATLAAHLQLDQAQIHLDNDARCQLWSAAWFERLLHANADMLYVGIDQGIGCAMIMAGQRILGQQLAAGELGHVRAGNDGRLCACGRSDCLETYCSINAVLAEVAQIRPDQALSSADLAAAAAADPGILAVLDRQARRLAEMLAGLVAVVDPGVLVLGAANLELAQLLANLLQRHLYSELVGLHAGSTAVVHTVAIADATIRGAAGRVLNKLFSSTIG